jgi:hypothetical protein
VVVAIAFVAALAAGAVAEATGGDTTTLIGLFLIPAGAITWFLGKRMNRNAERTLVDPNTGEPVVIRNHHTLFFVRVEWWGPIMAVLGIFLFITGIT